MEYEIYNEKEKIKFIKNINMGDFNLKNYKKIFLLIIAIIIASLFTGCNQEEKGFIAALIKSQEALKTESTTDIDFDLKVGGLDEKIQFIVGKLVNQLSDMKMSVRQKSVKNEGKTVSKAKFDGSVQLRDIGFNSSLWLDMDLRNNEEKLKGVVKSPSILMRLIPGAAGKEYIVLDFHKGDESIEDGEEDMAQGMNLDESIFMAMKYEGKLMDAFIEYMKKHVSLVNKIDDKIVDDEKIEYYQLTFDNESFKDFLKSTAISMVKDEDIFPLFREYMNKLRDESVEEKPERPSIDNIVEMVQRVTEFFDKLKEITILGENGILITYGVNEDGYIVSEEGSMDFSINIKEFMDLGAGSAEEDKLLQEMSKATVELMISYSRKTSNINQDIEVTIPNTTEENSIDYMELIEIMRR